MKFIQALLISFVLFASSLSNASTLDEIMKTGLLKVGTTGDFPGWSFKNPETNEYEGYDIDVAKNWLQIWVLILNLLLLTGRILLQV